MNKSEFISKVAEEAGTTLAEATKTVAAVFDTISNALSQGDSVTVVGFGSFKTSKREARTGRNPSTGAPIQISARTVPAFKAGTALKEAVNTSK
jgi:DNA-binding protein HU-beta